MNSGHDTMLTLATLVILPSGTRLYVIECSMTQMNLRRAQTENAAAPTTRGFARSFTEGNIKGGLGAVGKFALESNQGESEAMRNSNNINMVVVPPYHTMVWYQRTHILMLSYVDRAVLALAFVGTERSGTKQAQDHVGQVKRALGEVWYQYRG